MFLYNAKPRYDARRLTPSYKLWFTWTGWPDRAIPDEVFDAVAPLWDQRDDIRLLERHWDGRSLSLLVSTKPTVQPATVTGRLKGRLSHAMRSIDTPVNFRSNFGLRSVGENDREVLGKYLSQQVGKEGYADDRFAEFMETLTVDGAHFDLSEAQQTRGGLYWYDLHLVLVVEARSRISGERVLTKLRDGIRAIARKHDHRIGAFSVMQDHLHLLIRPTPSQSPAHAVLAYMNNLAYILGFRVWSPSPYLGTFGDYSMGAIRTKVAKNDR